MPFFKKKPVVVEARQFLGELENLKELADWIGQSAIADFDDMTLQIETLEGVHIATVGDFIIQGVKGEYYPCKPEIFFLTYEGVLA